MTSSVDAHHEFNKALKHLAAGREPHARAYLIKAILSDPDHRRAKNIYVERMKGHQIRANFDAHAKAIRLCLDDKYVDTSGMLAPWFSVLKHRGGFGCLRDKTPLTDYHDFLERVQPARYLKYLSNPYFLSGLSNLKFFIGQLEIFVTYIRRFFLENWVLLPQEHALPLASALGCQLFYNEFVNSVTLEETQLVSDLRLTLEDESIADDHLALALAIFGTYEPILKLHNAESLAARVRDTGVSEFDVLIRRQVTEPLEEREIEKTIPMLTPIEDTVSAVVREQYEENPYPRWHPWINLGKADRTLGEGRLVLDAGCGTGQSPISWASIFVGAQIKAVDITRASLAYAKRMTNQLEVNNIAFFQADILELRDWDERFDLVVSTGVLHHMKDPLAGWRVLTSLLKPGGAMMIGLYSEIARRPVVAARHWVEDQNLPANVDGIRRFREHVLTCDQDDPLFELRGWGDLYTTSSCRDLIFHVMEHRFTCLQLQDTMNQIGLKFLGFNGLPKRLLDAYDRMFPDDPKRLNLNHWHAFEHKAPRAFRGLYTFWCCRGDERPDNDVPEWARL